MRRCVFCLILMLCCALPVFADQRVEMAVDGGEGQPPFLDRAFDAALAQEIEAVLGTSLAPSRTKSLMEILGRERDILILGYSEASTAAGAEAVNATEATRTLVVRIDGAGLRNRLRDLGVMFTARASSPYVLQLSGVEPSRTMRLGALQELSGLAPTPAGGQDTPVLTLSQLGAWSAVLTLGEWRSSHTAKTLDEVWLAVWKDYFSRPGLAVQGESGLLVRVSGWLSSMGPMEFDRLMDSWREEVQHKTLVGVEMDGPGMVGVWRVQTRSRDALTKRLAGAAKAQGLTVEIR
ncbi:MAG: hypothetical protein KUA37_07740 [Desulfomicrobium sp.]|nr:hypothetical protein [Pseudomonadota bacterium]MBV1711883.1 hypothetical protein [Desulfomicrobium sp.]MBU4571060.1 hypothetical protein [Pseudomonadota bacterium]MBU4593689.1 hypothetical protein [Pseudomonadota bacterium]MBV1719055.1 hypothetical protein [Desulfomicrobium sp.]